MYPRPPMAAGRNRGDQGTGGAPDSDYYAILGVGPRAESEVIDAAYRALARKYHPDVNHAPDAADRTRALNEAYRVLHDGAARQAYDLERRSSAAAARRTPGPVESDRPVDFFGAALADVWRRAQAATRSPSGQTRSTTSPAAGRRTPRRWIPAASLVIGLAAGAGGASLLARRPGAGLRTYWQAASIGRASVVEARQRVEALSVGGYAALIASSTFGSVATQLIAELEGATARLRATGSVPPEAEAFHFLQLDDWREERELRVSQREAAQNRNSDAWATAVERENAWRLSGLHAKVEVRAAQLAALVARL
ncbi:MAG: J domain-containing protein [Chloroflexota bacterium]